jgi:hypothetical protein
MSRNGAILHKYLSNMPLASSHPQTLPRQDCSKPLDPVVSAFSTAWPFFLPRQDYGASLNPVAAKTAVKMFHLGKPQ